jgi:uncharacterized membrane protein
MNLIQLIWFFSIYSLFGWIWETIYLSIKYKKFIDTGFLKGPFCPLYGSCSIITIIFLSPLTSNLVLFYIFAVILATILEYITSILVEILFKIKFWDYSDDFKLNFQGRVALVVSLFCGLLLVTLIKFIHPQISLLINKIPSPYLEVGAIIIVPYFVLDTIFSTISLFGLKKILKTIKSIPKDFKEFRRHQIHFFKAFPQISSSKFNLIKDISQKINTKISKTSSES